MFISYGKKHSPHHRLIPIATLRILLAFCQIEKIIKFLCILDSCRFLSSSCGHLKSVEEELEECIAPNQNLSCFSTVLVWE